MNKDKIYEMIGYHGEYNKEVKAHLRKLLKKYHPDHNHGQDDMFKLINIVKKELEENQVNHYANPKNKDDKQNIKNSNYYENQLIKLNIQKKQLEEQIAKQNRVMLDLYDQYNLLNEEHIKNSELLCINKDNVSYLNNFKKRYIFYILSLFVSALSYKIFQSIPFLVLIIILVIIISLDIVKLYHTIRRITCDNQLHQLKNNYLLQNIKSQKHKINQAKRKLTDLNHDLLKINNDIRFYKNQLKKGN